MSLIRSKLAKSSYLVSRMVSTAQHRANIHESLVDFVGGRPIIDLRLANFDLLFCDAYARRVSWRWRKDGLRDAA